MTCILALDASTDACSVALAFDSGVTGLFELAAKSHTQRLLPMVDELLTQTGCQLSDVDAIAFGRGPGSFTGLRICLGVVQGLAFARRLPVIPVSTLAAMAAGYYRIHPHLDSPVLTALDARMNEVYWALFQPDSACVSPRILMDEQVMPPAEVAQLAELKALAGHFHGVGQGWHYAALQELTPQVRELSIYPQAEDIARMAQKAHAEGETVAPHRAQPVYLRDTVSWKKRTRIRN